MYNYAKLLLQVVLKNILFISSNIMTAMCYTFTKSEHITQLMNRKQQGTKTI